MKTFRVALAVAALVAGVAACGADAETEINETFKGYYAALLARDFPTACGYNAPESTERLLASVATQGISAATCEEAFTAIYEQPGAADTADAIARTAKISEVEVDGSEATVSWTADVDGTPTPITNGMRRVDGGWKLVAG